MRRHFPSLSTRVLIICLALLVLTGLALVGTLRHPPARHREAATGSTAELSARIRQLNGHRVLARARSSVTEKGRNPSLALTRLALAYPILSEDQKKQANRLLARPTDGAADPYRDGYATGTTVKTSCTTHFCLHWVTTTEDAPPLQDRDKDGIPTWIERISKRLEAIWTFEVDTMGYRPPAPDGTRGGDTRLDLYLAQLGSRGVYGYCPAETQIPGQQYTYSSYCVVDNDFEEFPLDPMPSFRITVAHELFHAIQYAYDAAEDPWIMEATATWMEERFADSVNDNRQYLPYGQLGNPKLPLDQFTRTVSPYGNWIFFEALTAAYGDEAVRYLWQRMDATSGARDQFSTHAINGFLRRHDSLMRYFYSGFAAGNLTPAATYEEGADYPATLVDGNVVLTAKKATMTKAVKLKHLTSSSWSFQPGPLLTGSWRVQLDLDLPQPKTGADARVIVQRTDGTLVERPVELDRDGVAMVRAGFDPTKVARVTVTLANGSTRFLCWKDSAFSCQGTPRDDMIDLYQVTATLMPPT